MTPNTPKNWIFWIWITLLIVLVGCTDDENPSNTSADDLSPDQVSLPDTTTPLLCEAPESACDSACVNLFSDPLHCGDCALACARAETCNQGQCALTCPEVQLACGDVCSTPASDPLHCGDCATACAPSDFCAQGQCVSACPNTLTTCGRSCTDTQTNPTHCGGCDQACDLPAAVPSCVGGVCGVFQCHRGFDDCDQNPENGCEVALDSNPSHCGTCNTACASDQVCAQGQCASSCPDTLSLCDQGCHDLSSDPSHCGACDRACDPPQTCTQGGCNSPPSRCGDNKADLIEACDGSDIKQSCQDLGFDTGLTSCNPDCTLNTSACNRWTPGALSTFDGLAFRYILAGTFQMGSPPTELSRDPSNEGQHSVTLTKPFWMKESEVTQGQWQTVMGNNPSISTTCGPDCPVENVNWWDAVQFCNALSAAHSLIPCYTLTDCTQTPASTCAEASLNPSCTGYRLPTEAEWEYAYRAGSLSAFHSGDITEIACGLDPNLDAIAWYCGNTSLLNPVKGKAPNAWGLHDMAGGVWEWCWDWYQASPPTFSDDPQGPATGTLRVVRGGSWADNATLCRAAVRGTDDPAGSRDSRGFRIVRPIP